MLQLVPAIIALVTVSALASPPVQWRQPYPETVRTPDGTVFQPEGEFAFWGLADSGDLLGRIDVSQAGAPAGNALVIGADLEWEIVHLTTDQATQWRPLDSTLLSDGRVIAKGFHPVSQQYDYREFTRTPTGWNSTVRVAQAETVGEFWLARVNDAGEILWFESATRPGEYEPLTEGVFMIERGEGPEVYQTLSQLGAGYQSFGGPAQVYLVNSFLDDASLVYEIADDFGYYLVRRAMDGTVLRQQFYSVDIGEINLGIFSRRGDFLSLSYEMRWRPTSAGGVAEFFIPNAGNVGFRVWSFWVGGVGPGWFIFSAVDSAGTGLGLYIGPDEANDRVFLSGDPLLQYDAILIDERRSQFVLNERREFIAALARREEIVIDDQVFTVDLPTVFLATLCPADMNRDSIFDNGDITAFVQTYLAGSLRADFSNDGILDNADIAEFVNQYLAAITTGCG